MHESPVPRDTQCACGCGEWTHVLSMGDRKIYKSGHKQVDTAEEGGVWKKLAVGEIIRPGDRVRGANGPVIERNSAGVGHKVNDYVPIYRKQ